jgi:hypothetical protein
VGKLWKNDVPKTNFAPDFLVIFAICVGLSVREKKFVEINFSHFISQFSQFAVVLCVAYT